MAKAQNKHGKWYSHIFIRRSVSVRHIYKDGDVQQINSNEQLPKLLYKYLSVADIEHLTRLHDIIENHHIYFPKYDNLNDPLEGAAIDIHNGGYAGYSMYVASDVEDPFIAPYKESYRILSLAKSPINPQLWAHYGGNYTGICLCFSTEGCFSSAQKMNYFDQKPIRDVGEEADDDDKKIDALVHEGLLMKQSGWSYEEEWRVLQKESSEFFCFDPKDLVGVIVGHKMPREIQTIIKGWIPPKVKRMKIWPGVRSFKMKLTDIDYEKDESGCDGSEVPEIANFEEYLLSK